MQHLDESDCDKVGEEFDIKNNVNYLSANAGTTTNKMVATNTKGVN